MTVILSFSGSSAYAVSVRQTPHVINVAEGANDNITCHFYVPYNTLDTNRRVTITWKKDNATNVHSETIHLHDLNTFSSVLQFHSLLRNQSGWYTCEVKIDIPMLRVVQGNGTYVIVTGKAVHYFSDRPLVHSQKCVKVMVKMPEVTPATADERNINLSILCMAGRNICFVVYMKALHFSQLALIILL